MAKSEEKVGVEEKERERGRPSTVIIIAVCEVLVYCFGYKDGAMFLLVPLFVSCVSMMSLK